MNRVDTLDTIETSFRESVIERFPPPVDVLRFSASLLLSLRSTEGNYKSNFEFNPSTALLDGQDCPDREIG
jgi:hypothetical protein